MAAWSSVPTPASPSRESISWSSPPTRQLGRAAAAGQCRGLDRFNITSPARRWITRAGTGRVLRLLLEPGALDLRGRCAHLADDHPGSSLPEFQLLYADVGGVLTSEPAVRPRQRQSP